MKDGNSYSNISGSIIGDNNVVINNQMITDKEWEELKSETMHIVRNLPETSNDSKLIEELYTYIVKKDERGIRGFIKRNIAAFNISMLSGIASEAFMEFIQRCIGQ